MGGSIEIRVLGPIEVLVDGRQVELGGGNERALIGYLALHPNTPVSADAIIAALWGELRLCQEGGPAAAGSGRLSSVVGGAPPGACVVARHAAAGIACATA